MKDPMIYDCMDFPAESFGEGITRDIRLIASPETTGEERIRIVLASVPAGAVSEGHAHPDADEYIYFDIAGKAIMDGVEYDVPANGLVHAKQGVVHECVNIDPQKTLTLYCVFVPAFEPYGAYPALIEKTKQYLNGKG